MKWEWFDIEMRDDGYVFFGDWRVPKSFSARKKILRDFKDLEKMLHKGGFKGWLGGAYIGDWKMMRLIEGVGGKPYSCDGESIFYYKKFNGSDQ